MQDRMHDGVSAAAALEEPTRRRLYDYVVRMPHPVGRDEAAAALDLPRQTAAFHLDRLADEGLLEVSWERRSGRAGPGAGRPAKLYARSAREFRVQLPERRYDLAGSLLAGVLAEVQETAAEPGEVLGRRARELGARLAAYVVRERGALADVAAVLEGCGFEPVEEGGGVALRNCPFHALAQEHTALVCGMNLHLVEGVLDGVGSRGLTARLAPEPGHCCVRLEPGTP